MGTWFEGPVFTAFWGFLDESGLPSAAGEHTVPAGWRKTPSMGLNDVGSSASCQEQQIVCKDSGTHCCDVMFPSLVITAE